MNASVASPTFSEVAEFVREFAGLRSAVQIHPHTRLDADLGVTGGDGDDLLLRVAEHFDARLLGADGYITTFGLASNEYLFHPEGLDVLGIGALIGLLTGHRKQVVRDLKVGELHAAICSNRSARAGADSKPDPLRASDQSGRQPAGGSMRDIDVIIAQLHQAHPDISATQLTVLHPGVDDDGLWFFSHPANDIEVQLESSSGNCPFLFESTGSMDRLTADSVQQAVGLVVAGLGVS